MFVEWENWNLPNTYNRVSGVELFLVGWSAPKHLLRFKRSGFGEKRKQYNKDSFISFIIRVLQLKSYNNLFRVMPSC